MTVNPTSRGMEWLPDTYLEAARLVAPFRDNVQAWCAHWFARTQWSVTGQWTETRTPNADQKAAFERDGLGVYASDKARLSVAAAMLGLPLDKAVPRNADARLIDAIAAEALADLGARCADLIGTAHGVQQKPSCASDALYLAIIDGAKKPVLTIRVEREALVAFAKAQAPAPRVRSRPARKREILDALSLSVGAKIGAVHLPLSDLKALGVGDVITFNQPVDADLPLTVNGVAGDAATLKLRTHNHTLFLKMTRPVAHDQG